MTSAPMRNDVQPALAPDMIRWNWDGCSGLRRGFVNARTRFGGFCSIATQRRRFAWRTIRELVPTGEPYVRASDC
jgi:hypothetical protein